MKLAATLHSPASGRYMDLSTNMPGLQFYSGNNLNGSVTGKGAYPYPVYGGLALETQVSPSRNPGHCYAQSHAQFCQYHERLTSTMSTPAALLHVTRMGSPAALGVWTTHRHIMLGGWQHDQLGP